MKMKALRPYLVDYPFPASRLKMHIQFCDSKYSLYRDGSMHSLDLEDNEFKYYQEFRFHEKEPVECWWNEMSLLAQESYPKASKIVEDSTSIFTPIDQFIKDIFSWITNFFEAIYNI